MKEKIVYDRERHENPVDWGAASIKGERMNGLRLKAVKERRSIATVLDMILEKAGIPLLSNEDFEALSENGGIPAK